MIEFIKLFIITFVLTDMGEFLGGLIAEFNLKNKYLNILKYLISYVLTCSKCFTFWFSIIYTGDLFISTLTALLINYLKEIEYKYLKNKTEL